MNQTDTTTFERAVADTLRSRNIIFGTRDAVYPTTIDSYTIFAEDGVVYIAISFRKALSDSQIFSNRIAIDTIMDLIETHLRKSGITVRAKRHSKSDSRAAHTFQIKVSRI